MRLIDSHCHLNYEGLAERQDEVLDTARARGRRRFPQHLDAAEGMGRVIATAERNADVWASVGVHPHEADAHPDLGAAALVEASDHPRSSRSANAGSIIITTSPTARAARAVRGAYRGGAGDRPAADRPHPRCGGGHGRDPRRALSKQGGVTGVLHCFTGSADLARKALDLGFFISLSGIVTFKNARDLQETAKTVPLDRLLVETDSPFLAPVPHRGKTCEPAFVADTAAFVADLRGEELEALAEATTANFFRLFNRAAGVKLRILGCGTSTGVPQDRQRLGPLRPDEPRNRRLRSSILVESGGERLLVDCGPDLREQLLDAEIGRIDALIVTHDHADHCHGIDDLRPLSQALGGRCRSMPAPTTLERLQRRFALRLRPGGILSAGGRGRSRSRRT